MIQFKIGSLVSCLLCVDPALVHHFHRSLFRLGGFMDQCKITQQTNKQHRFCSYFPWAVLKIGEKPAKGLKKKKATLKNDKSGFLEPQFEEIRDGWRLQHSAITAANIPGTRTILKSMPHQIKAVLSDETSGRWVYCFDSSGRYIY